MILPEISHANKDRELIDVRAFNFPVEVYAIPNFEREFFEVFDEDVWRPGRERVFIVNGYPIEFQEFEYDGKPYVHGRCLQTVGLDDGASNAPYSHRLIMKRRGSFDADGMSGGAVFYLGIDKTGFFVGLAGMIMRGSATSNYLHSVEASALRLFASTPVELGNNARDGYAPAP